jgi:hypothetical protein
LRGRELFLKKDQDDLLYRIENWRKVYRPTLRILSVPWYKPPDAGDVFDGYIAKIPLRMQDAFRLELCWRGLTNQGMKFYIKWEYLSYMKPQAIWRKILKYDVKIRSHAEHDEFNKRSLEYFNNNLKKDTL